MVGSLALVLIAVVVLSAGRLFSKPHKFVCFFQGSLNGLRVGAPVKARGVQIGSVTQILLRLPRAEGTLRVQESLTELPVIFEIDESQLKARGGTGKVLQSGELMNLIQRGLRAQLGTESFLTGLLYIDLDLHPGTPANFVMVPGSGPYREIPTIPTDLQQVQESAMRTLANFEKIDFGALAGSMTNAANAVRDLLGSPNLRATLGSLRSASANLNTTLVAFRQDLALFNGRVDPVLTSLKKTSDHANLALAQMTTAVAQLQMTLAPDAPLAYRLNIALQDFSQASNAMRELADYLQRNPSALVRGKYVSESSR